MIHIFFYLLLPLINTLEIITTAAAGKITILNTTTHFFLLRFLSIINYYSAKLFPVAHENLCNVTSFSRTASLEKWGDNCNAVQIVSCYPTERACHQK